MAFCTNCGQRVDSSAKFCGNCGNKVESSAPAPSAETPKKVEKSKGGQAARVPANVRIAPIYGDSYDPDIHCANCGAKRGSSKSCSTCGE